MKLEPKKDVIGVASHSLFWVFVGRTPQTLCKPYANPTQTLCKPYANPMNYHNEHEPKTAAWLRCLIEDGLLPPGHVDERTIEDVTPTDLKGYTQCHFFAGIGGWPHALDLAGWRGRPCWTGSPPCQPFSRAGKKQGTDDARHLWPTLRRLIDQCCPPLAVEFIMAADIYPQNAEHIDRHE